MRWTYEDWFTKRKPVVFAGIIFLTSTLVGCSVYKALFKELPLSENYALRGMGSSSTTAWIIDGDLEYGEKTKFLPVVDVSSSAEDNYTGVDVILSKVRNIGEIRIYNEKLEHCDILFHVPGGAENEWIKVKEIKQNLNPLLIVHPRGREGMDTDQVRIMVRRTLPSSGGTSSGGGGKDGEPFIDINPIIKEVELYKILGEGEQPKEEKK